jgi:hypothetical protein
VQPGLPENCELLSETDRVRINGHWKAEKCYQLSWNWPL